MIAILLSQRTGTSHYSREKYRDDTLWTDTSWPNAIKYTYFSFRAAESVRVMRIESVVQFNMDYAIWPLDGYQTET